MSGEKTLTFMTAEPHSFKARRMGQLYTTDNSDLGVLSPLSQKDLKISTVPSDSQFTIHNPIRGLEQKQLADWLSVLQTGILQFGQSLDVDTSRYILHTMMCTSQVAMLAEADNLPITSPQDFAAVALEMLPNPTDAGPSNSHDKCQEADFSQSQPQVISDLIVGPSNSPHESTALNVHSNAKVTGIVTARGLDIFSDERLKTNIVPAKASALSALEKIGIFRYRMTQDQTGKEEIGLLAQDLQCHLPDTVEQDEATGLFTVKLDKLIVYVLMGIVEASAALKKLDASQPMGMPLMMQSALDSYNNHSADSGCNIATNSPLHSDDTVMPDADASNPLQQASAMPAATLNFKDDTAMIQHIIAELGETNPGMPVKTQKLLDVLGRTAIWETFQQARHTTVPAQDGKPKSPGSTFLTLLKQQQSSQKSRQAQAEEIGRTNKPLYGFQQQLLDQISHGGNYIIVARTGSGKTRVALEAAGLVFSQNSAAHVLFLTPTVALAEQQTGVFRAANCIPNGVEGFSSENPLSAQQWPLVLQHNRVLIMTADTFLNMLLMGVADLQAFSLMVFDECHHTQAKHPYNKIAQQYKQLSPEHQKRLQVLGLTATPAVASSLALTYAKLDSLKQNMSAIFLVVSADNPEMKQVVGETQEITWTVSSRSEDNTFAVDLGKVLLKHVSIYMNQQPLSLTGSQSVAEISHDLQHGRWSAGLKHWLETQLAAYPTASQLVRSHLILLQDCNTALSLNRDTGFEIALQHLASRCLAYLQSNLGPNSAQPETNSAASQMPDSHNAEPTAETTVLSDAAAASLSRALMSDLSGSVCHLQVALQALAATQLGTKVSFPRFQKLVAILTDMQDRKEAWHAIVFVKERQSVHAITAMLDRVQELKDISFHAFTGRATSSKRHTEYGQTAGQRSDGMKLREQRNALSQFKEAEGKAVLVATAAAEEGLDIIQCELVVCYTVVETGRQMMQRRGRARMAGSRFICIAEAHEEGRLADARLAECNAKIAQLHM